MKTACLRKDLHMKCPYVDIERLPQINFIYCKVTPCPYASELLLKELIEAVKDLKPVHVSVM